MKVRGVSWFAVFAVKAAGVLWIVLSWQTSAARAQACFEDSDCEAGFECDLPPVGCIDRGGEAPDCWEPSEGECEPALIACADDADCPLGLRCEAEDDDSCAGAAPAGGDGEDDGDPEAIPADLGCEPEAERAAYCVLALVECASDDVCAADHACQAIGREDTCTSQPATCAPGESCEPPEEVCTERELNYCFPVRRDCTRDDDCQTDWRCALLPEDAQDHPPAGFEGATQICVPEGLWLFFAGHAKASRSARGTSAQASGQSAGDALSESDADGARKATGEGGGGSGCSVGRGARGGLRFGVTLLLISAVLLARRK